MSPILRKIIRICAPVALYLVIWQLLSMLVDSSLLLPSPLETAKAMAGILGTAAGWRSIGTSVLRILCGFALGCLIGVILAVLTAKCATAAWLLHPLRTLVKTTPITSFALILLISVVSGLVPVAVAAIVVTPMIWRTTEESILGLDDKLAEMGKVFFKPVPRESGDRRVPDGLNNEYILVASFPDLTVGVFHLETLQQQTSIIDSYVNSLIQYNKETTI